MPVKSKRRKVKRLFTNRQLNAMPLHKLMTIALRDTARQERAKNSRVDMGTYLKRNGECIACFAGSVLRWSCAIPKRLLRSNGLFNGIGPHWAYALNCLRCGEVTEAVFEMGRGPYCSKVNDRFVPGYSDESAEWWIAMRQLAKELKDAGI